MAHRIIDGKELLDIWQAAIEDDDDFLRRLLEHLLQRVLEAEFTEFLGAEPHERTERRRGYRNGYRPRMLTTRVGKLDLLVPRDREGRFSTELFERYQRSEKALVLSLMEMYVQGVSTRKVKKITEQLCGVEVSRSVVSELAKGLDEQIEAWRTCEIEEEYPYLIVDALFEKVRHGLHVKSDAVLVVTGISTDGYRRHLGVWLADVESKQTWLDAFGELKERGLKGVHYVVSDKHQGIEAAVARRFQGCVWHRCQAHFRRNLCQKLRASDRSRGEEIMNEITRAPSIQDAREALADAVEELSEKYSDVADWLEEDGEEILGVYALPPSHRKRMRTTNMLERWFKEIRRRTKVVSVFPNRSSCLRLIAAQCMEANEDWLERRYLKFEPEQREEWSAGWPVAEADELACDLAPVPSASSHANSLEM